MPSHRFTVLEGSWAVARLSPLAPLPAWAFSTAAFTTVTRSDDELSIVCPEKCVPAGTQVEAGWSVIKLLGPFPPTASGVLASFLFPLAAVGISIFAVSTFETNFILVRPTDLPKACDVLVRSGHKLESRIPAQKST